MCETKREGRESKRDIPVNWRPMGFDGGAMGDQWSNVAARWTNMVAGEGF